MPATMPQSALRVAVIVRVVDNFGDAGVAWRLARQLHAEHGCNVSLWIDAPAVLARFLAELDAARDDTIIGGVRVRRLPPPGATVAPPLDPWPDVLVEAFGGGVPAAWIDAIEAARVPPVWIHLEYLSAEDWVEGAHGLPSPHPTRGYTRWFFYPGFTPRTGGLLRERGLPESLRDDRGQAWADVALPPPPTDALALSLFCYPTASLIPLLRAWAREAQPVHVLVPDGVASAALQAFLGTAPAVGSVHFDDSLCIAVVPFVDQDAFDRRLAACDFALVRGEDSFVRAQWARVPFAWHIYPQDDDAHRVKLAAFLARYTAALDPHAAEALRAFTFAFTAGDGTATAAAWPAVRHSLPALRTHARHWAADLARQRDLATQLVEFARSRL